MSEPNEKAFAERMGDFFDRLGLPRIAGKLFGYLLVCDPPEQNADQLKEFVSASAGSVSTMLRMLQLSGMVERRSEPGGRRLWYWIAPGAFSRVLTMRMQLVGELSALAETGLAEMKLTGRGKRGERLREMRDCYAFFDREFPVLVERYKSTKET